MGTAANLRREDEVEGESDDEGDAGRTEKDERLKLVMTTAKGKDEAKNENKVLMKKLLAPVIWMLMLCRELNASFVFGVIVTYGVSQGFGGAVYRIAVNYFWKDSMGVQPSVAQIYTGIIGSVWDWKPVWGLLTDLVPVSGYHRRPYFILSGLLSFFSLITLILDVKLQNVIAVTLLLLDTLGITIADVTIDAEVAKQSREKPELATDMQTLCSMSASVGSFIGFCSSGFIVHAIGPKNTLGILSVSGALFFVLGFTFHEAKTDIAAQVYSKLSKTVRSIFETLSCPQVWKPVLYMFISWASSPSLAEGKFYWYTDKTKGLGFSEEFVGMSFAVGSVGAILGTIIYQNGLKNCSFRKIMLWAQILVFLGGTVDLMLVLRWNRWLHMPDSIFFLFDEITIQSVGKLKWIPQFVLCAKLCPAGIEGTFFALLMAVDNVGLLTSTWGGALLQQSLGVTRENFSNLWLAAAIRTFLRLLPLLFLFLIPDVAPSSELLPPDIAVSHISDDNCEYENPDLEEAHQAVELIAKR